MGIGYEIKNILKEMRKGVNKGNIERLHELLEPKFVKPSLSVRRKKSLIPNEADFMSFSIDEVIEEFLDNIGDILKQDYLKSTDINYLYGVGEVLLWLGTNPDRIGLSLNEQLEIHHKENK